MEENIKVEIVEEIWKQWLKGNRSRRRNGRNKDKVWKENVLEEKKKKGEGKLEILKGEEGHVGILRGFLPSKVLLKQYSWLFTRHYSIAVLKKVIWKWQDTGCQNPILKEILQACIFLKRALPIS